MGINQFTDLDPEDFPNDPKLSVFIPEGRFDTFFAVTEDFAETSVDWRDKGAVLDVQKQGDCYSEWAFSGVSKIVLILMQKYHDKCVIKTDKYDFKSCFWVYDDKLICEITRKSCRLLGSRKDLSSLFVRNTPLYIKKRALYKYI